MGDAARAVVFWGGTGQAKVLREAMGGADFRLIAVFDRREIPAPFGDVPLYVGDRGFEEWRRAQTDLTRIWFAVAIGGGRGYDRLAIHDRLASLGMVPFTIHHRRAYLASDAVAGEGCQLLANSAVCSQARLGKCVIVNTSASVDHDCRVGDGTHIGPGATITGEVQIGAGVFVGAGAVVLPRLSIGEGAVIGAGAVVTRSVPARMTVVGNPARELPSRAG